ncbi:lipopolysaccharide biosynthesis protein [Pseudalkalibacillus sp. JSM 102089]|uniref:lipopolysaccharide biosynthesis protein n=1 Tax=Pseudalkalibacillus sp. JSM 102089 TaxID=3229856 RepID=UPI0035236A41
MGSLTGKRILFIAPTFFGYEKEIKEKMISLGASVDFFDERPSNDFITKSLIRINRNLIAKKNDEHYESIISSTKDNFYDYILLIRGEAISRKKLKELKISNPKSKLILYLWDSINYNPNTKRIMDLFDSIYTFDINDANKYKEMKFRPLFYIDIYNEISNESITDDSIDLLFVGTVHTDRYLVLQSIKKQLDYQGVNYYFYMYYPSKLLFWVKKLFDPKFRSANMSDFNFKGLNKQELRNFYKRSKVILDIERPKQVGLTIRTLEVMGAKKKLITTNESVKKYDLYNSKNIFIVNRDKPEISKEFFVEKGAEIDKKIYSYYSIEAWIKEVLSSGENSSN